MQNQSNSRTVSSGGVAMNLWNLVCLTAERKNAFLSSYDSIKIGLVSRSRSDSN